MKKITNKEYIEYQDYKRAKANGQILTPDGLKFIYRSYNTAVSKNHIE